MPGRDGSTLGLWSVLTVRSCVGPAAARNLRTIRTGERISGTASFSLTMTRVTSCSASSRSLELLASTSNDVIPQSPKYIQMR